MKSLQNKRNLLIFQIQAYNFRKTSCLLSLNKTKQKFYTKKHYLGAIKTITLTFFIIVLSA